MRVELHERLTKLRRQHSFTQQQVADRLGISRGAYSNYELGSREPDADNLAKLAALYDVTTDYLITGKAHGSSSPPVSPEEAEFLEWAKQVDSVFFYDFHKSPDEQKKQFMETLRALWEVEKKRGNKPNK